MTPVPTGLPGAFHRRRLPSLEATSSPLSLALRNLLEAAPTGLAEPELREAQALLAESDPGLLAAGLASLAGRLERSGDAARISFALQLYQIAAGHEGTEGRLARERLAVSQGGGSTGARAEFLLRGLARQASDPALLFGMGLASGVFSLTRAMTLSRLLAAPTASALTRGFGARALASVAGFAVEAPVFTLGTRLGAEALGRGQDWSRAALGRDLASSYLVLGAMKMAHGGSAALYGRSRLLGVGRVPPLQGLFQQTATLGGILLGHQAETALGLRPAQSASQTLTDSLAMLLQFHVAGRLSAHLIGRPYAAMEAALDRQSRVGASGPSTPAEGDIPGLAVPFPFGLRPALVGPSAPLSRPLRESPLPAMQLSLMSALRPEGGGMRTTAPIEARLDQLVRPEFGDGAVTPPPRNGGRSRRAVRRIGILTSGGDGPGENAAILALVRGAIQVHGWEPVGVFDGYKGLLQPEGRIRELLLTDVSGEAAVGAALQRLYGGRIPPGLAATHVDISTLGGDILRSSRTNPVQGDPQATRVKETMRAHGLDALIVLGGNGSMRAANALREAGVPVVGIPQSIDLDVWGSEHSLGFPSAVAKGASEVHHFHNTAHSCDRWFLVEVMGQHYGMLTLAVGRESRVADSAFIEVPRPLSDIRDVIERARATRAHGVLLFSEGVKFRGEGVSTIEPPRGTDVHGRLVVESGDVVRWLRAPLAEMGITHTRPESLGYLLRGADPTPHEIGLAKLLAAGALRLVETGHFGRMAGTGFAEGSAELRLVYPKLSRVARLQKPAPEEYFLHVRDLLERRGE